ncbi:MAG: alpha/beta hydrolase [Clostridia bacterium]|nr:alpha/beta hydrolase [Clostridia bacterium]
MEWWTVALIVVGAIAFLTFLVALYCYFRIFYSPKRKEFTPEQYDMPDGEDYEPYKAAMVEWIKAARARKSEECQIVSRDGLKLKGKYYECSKGAPIEILFHGYRGSAERDLSAGIERCFALNRNALIVDQRASGNSEGRTITFGIKERFDCLDWVDFCVQKFGKDTKIILTGISMGAATVMMAAGEKLPANVVCVLADCGYSSPREIIQKVIRDMRLPPKLVYPFVKLGARLIGGFNLDEASPKDKLKKTAIPVVFIHGKNDNFVPCQMSEELYDVCASPKSIALIDGAGHGLSYPANKQKYLNVLKEFEKVWNK